MKITHRPAAWLLYGTQTRRPLSCVRRMSVMMNNLR